ncbi:MAG: N-formyl-4-amino-5-aminomethyl-2-methylpyrimidine deformylase [Syntrophaceae bacterium PtaU1.Bin231]|nr:MAG: N-formyl-4-amino-5-aminomethyl-2-methylpyrimidine deformylase [Syntrophaceae bacterium PtaU1.Bin231]HOG17902.1 M20/M25/M40 family metallo-hydrolase [Syntrophales bacterium]
MIDMRVRRFFCIATLACFAACLTAAGDLRAAGLSKEEKKLVDAIEEKRAEIIDALATLVRIPSRTGDEGDVQKYQAESFRRMGMDVDVWEPDVRELFEKFPDVAQNPSRWQPEWGLALSAPGRFSHEALIRSPYDAVKSYRGRPNVVGLLKGSGGGRSLVLNGHADTINLGDEKGWKAAPFAAQSVVNRLYGRGAADMKGGLVAAQKAVQAVVEAGIRLQGDVILQSVVNGEYSGNGTLACILRGYRADAAIVNRSTGSGRVIDDSSGVLYFEVRTKGREVYAEGRRHAPPGDGKSGEPSSVSAVEKMAVVISALTTLERDLNDLYGPGVFQLAIGIVRGGNFTASSARDCVLHGALFFNVLPRHSDFAGVPGVWNVWSILSEAVARAARRDPWLRENPPAFSIAHYAEPFNNLPDAPIVKAIQDAYRDVAGKEIRLAGFHPPAADGRGEAVVGKVLAWLGPGAAHAAGDMRHLGNAGQMSTVAYGPTGGNIHALDEWVDLEDLMTATKVLAVVVARWCR